MLKRTLICGMWFVALWSLGGIASFFLDLPRGMMIIPTLAGVSVVWIGLARYDAWQAERSLRLVWTGHTDTPSSVGASTFGVSPQ